MDGQDIFILFLVLPPTTHNTALVLQMCLPLQCVCVCVRCCRVFACALGWLVRLRVHGRFVRIDLKKDHPDRFATVRHLVDRVLSIEWGKAARVNCPLAWAATRTRQLGMLVDTAKINRIVTARGSTTWQSDCHDDIQAILTEDSEVIDRMFSSSQVAVTNSRVGVILDGFRKLLAEHKPEKNNVYTTVDIGLVKKEASQMIFDMPG